MITQTNNIIKLLIISKMLLDIFLQFLGAQARAARELPKAIKSFIKQLTIFKIML